MRSHLRPFVARTLRREDGSGCSTLVLTTLTVCLALIIVPAVPPIALPFEGPGPGHRRSASTSPRPKVIHLHIGRSAHSFSMSEIPLIAGPVPRSPRRSSWRASSGRGSPCYFARRQRSVKLAFNLAQFVSPRSSRSRRPRAVPGRRQRSGPPLWIAALVAALVENVVGVLTVSTAISLAEGTAQYRRMPEMLKIGVIVSLTNASLALMGLTVLWTNPDGLAVRRADRDRGLRVSRLHRPAPAAREHRAALRVDPDPPAQPAARARDRVAAGPRPEDVPRRHRRDRLLPRQRATRSCAARSGPATPSWRCTRSGWRSTTRCSIGAVDRAPGPPRRPAAGRGTGRRRAPATAARRWSRRWSASRRSSGRSSSSDSAERDQHVRADELKLFETLANHTAIALENGQLEQSLEQLRQLKEELHHQASHDPLTGLANRSLFTQVGRRAARSRIRAAPAGRAVRRPRRLQARQRQPRPRRGRRAAGRGRRPARGRSCAPATSPRGSAATSSPCSCGHAGHEGLDAGRQPADRGDGPVLRDRRPRGERPRQRRCRRGRPGVERPASCCATPTSRCTRRRLVARAGWSSSSRRCTRP